MKKPYLTATGVRLGKSGKVANTPEKVADLLRELPKGQRRQIRKGLFAKGMRSLAAAKIQ